MGNRENLLAGAKRCLYDKGYARTTARDISAAAGTSLAAIGYHFGSTEALLNAALYEAMQEWGDELARALSTDGHADGARAARFEAAWSRVIDTVRTHRALWSTRFELVTQLERAPEMREFFADAQQQTIPELAELFEGDRPDDEESARLAGSLYQALLTGVVLQWLVYPEHAMSGRDLVRAIRLVADRLGPAVPGT